MLNVIRVIIAVYCEKPWEKHNLKYLGDIQQIINARSQNCVKRLYPSLYLSVRPSFRMEQFGSHCKNFHEISYLKIFLKSVEEI